MQDHDRIPKKAAPEPKTDDASEDDGAGSDAPSASAEPGASPELDTAAPKGSTVTYTMSPGLAGWLARERIGLAVTSYQSGKLYLIGTNPQGGLMINERVFTQAMGLAVPEPGTLLMAGAYQIHRFRDVLEPGERINGLHDSCYVPRLSWTVGALDLHDVGQLPGGEPVFVATGWNCIATVSDRHAFRPLWMPPFVSSLVREDRCHLNGMAMGPEGPAFATACSRSDTVDGWRDRRQSGGVVVDVATDHIVVTGLSMPHSPRLHEGQLYVFNSGAGELGRVNLEAPPEEAFEPIAFCPGFVRGLALHGGRAIVGLSQPRYRRFEGLALDDRLRETDSEAWCGFQVVSLASGAVEHWFRIDGVVGEMYDVAVLPGATCPMALGTGTRNATAETANLVTHEPMPDRNTQP